MVAGPRSVFDGLATFEPYSQHFLQDIEAFQVGLGVVVLLASTASRVNGLAVALVGVGVGATLHTVSLIGGHDLGGDPESGIPFFAVIAVLLLVSGGYRRGFEGGSAR